MQGNAMPHFLKFEYLRNAIVVDGTKLGIIKSHCLSAERLLDWIIRNRYSPERLLGIAGDIWRLCEYLASQEIAHGDICPETIFVSAENELQLAFSPNFNFGDTVKSKIVDCQHQDWSHPKVNSDKSDSTMDQFPGFLLYVSILAVAFRPNLMSESSARVNGSWLFGAEDLAHPLTSDRMVELFQLHNGSLSSLTEILMDWCGKDKSSYSLDSIRSNTDTPYPGLTRFDGARQGTVKPITHSATVEPPREAEKKPRIRIMFVAAVVLVVGVGAFFLGNLNAQRRQATDESTQLPRQVDIDTTDLLHELGRQSTSKPKPKVTPVETLTPRQQAVTVDRMRRTFYLEPVDGRNYVKFRIYTQDNPDKLVLEQFQDQREVELPEGEYGYAFVDSNGVEFGYRKRGFAVR